MRYEIRPDNLLEQSALWLDVVPLPAVEMLVPLLKVRAIMSGVRLGIFERLAGGKLEATTLAEQSGLDAECLGLLLRVLVGARYLESDGKRFWLAPIARKSLVRGAKNELTAYVEFNYMQWQFLEELESTLRAGHGIDFHRSLMSSSPEWRTYQRAMLQLARPVAPWLGRKVPVPAGARRLLDLGGAHGLLGAAICRAHPPLRSIVFDLPGAVEEARQLAEQEGICDVVEHRAGDILEVDLGSGADVVLLSNVLHHFTKTQSAELLDRVHRALVSGGTLAVWELELPDASAKPDLVRDAIALYFRVTSSGIGLSPGRLARWLERARFSRVKSWRSPRAPGWVLVHARRP